MQKLYNVASIISFVTDDTIRIVDNLYVDCIFEIQKNNLKLISQCKLDNQYALKRTLGVEECQLNVIDASRTSVYDRLILIGQDYKTRLTHLQNLQNTGTASEFNLLANLFRVNYEANWDDPLARFDVELSFTMIDWSLVDQLVRHNEEQIEYNNEGRAEH